MAFPISNAIKVLCSSKVVKKIEHETFKHAPELLITLGITGFITGTVYAVKNTPKVVKKIELEKQNKDISKLKVKDVIRVAAPAYIPTLVIDAVSIAAIIGANKIKSKRYAALAAVYQLSTAAFESYKNHVSDTIGETKNKEIQEKIAGEAVADAFERRNDVVFIEGSGNEMCYDMISDRFFYSDKNTLLQAQNEFNADLISQGVYSTINEFYTLIGLKPVGFGYEYGWDIDKGYLDLKISSIVATDLIE